MQECVYNTQKKITDEISLINEQQHSSLPWKVEEKKSSGAANYFGKGKVIEKGCANVSVTLGAPVFEVMAQKLLPEELRKNYSKYCYYVASLSTIFHPISPLIPSIHANYRYFEIVDESGNIIHWFFGGGADLAPSYLFEEDAVHFHTTLKKPCDKVDNSFYRKLKKDADEYFYLPHRKEHRGIGGTFSFVLADKPKEAIYNWVVDSCNAFLPSYIPIIKKRMNDPYTEKQKDWQLIRRGRYAEFILLCDVGFRFGLNSGANPEKDFMPMPPVAKWDHLFIPEPNSPEEKMVEVLKTPREWV